MYQDSLLGVVNSFRGSFVGVFNLKVVHLITLLTLHSLGVLFVNLVIFEGLH